jgi:CspA family cold shock protein
MTNGTVKWFDAQRGYGFIQPEDGAKDAFVHVSALEQAGLSTLREGQKISYELALGTNGKTAATNIQTIDV